jgi:hypothetical protein
VQLEAEPGGAPGEQDEARFVHREGGRFHEHIAEGGQPLPRHLGDQFVCEQAQVACAVGSMLKWDDMRAEKGGDQSDWLCPRQSPSLAPKKQSSGGDAMALTSGEAGGLSEKRGLRRMAAGCPSAGIRRAVGAHAGERLAQFEQD